MSNASLYTRGVVFVLLGTFCFAAKGILIKLAYGFGITATPLLMLRMLFALPFYLAFAIWLQTREQTPLTHAELAKIIGLGLLSYYISSLFDFMGLQYISAGLERLTLYVYPTLVLILNAMIYARRIGLREKLAIGLAYAGMLLVFVHDVHLNNSWQLTALGTGLVLVSTITFAVFIVLAGDLIPRVGSLRFTSYGMIAACVGVITHNLVVQGVQSAVQPMPVYGLALAMAIACTVIPSFLMNEGMRIIGSNRAAILGTIGPVVTLFLGAWALNEAIGLIQFTGAALVIGGVAIATAHKAK